MEMNRMKRIISKSTLILFALVLTGIVTRAQFDLSREKSRYPNELPNLQLYESAKWKSIVPYVSTRDDVERALGAPARVYDQRFYVKKFDDYLVGYDHNLDWIIIVTYIAEGGSLPPSLVGRVSDISVYPRKRISLQGMEFPPAFTRSTYENNKTELTVYHDKFGLKYSIYSRVSAGDSHEIGDLEAIEYGVSDEDEAKAAHP
jgi:hypothetical protein